MNALGSASSVKLSWIPFGVCFVNDFYRSERCRVHFPLAHLAASFSTGQLGNSQKSSSYLISALRVECLSGLYYSSNDLSLIARAMISCRSFKIIAAFMLNFAKSFSPNSERINRTESQRGCLNPRSAILFYTSSSSARSMI